MRCLGWWHHAWSKWETFEVTGNRYKSVDDKMLSCPFTAIKQKRSCVDCGIEQWRTVEDVR